MTVDHGVDEEGGNGTSGLRGKEVQIVTQEDIDGKKYNITDVVLPMAGSRIQYPTNGTGKLFETMLAEDGLTMDVFKKIGDKELALGGDYRKIICKPHDVDFEIKKYKDPFQPLIQTDLMKLKNIPLECIDLKGGDETGEEKTVVGKKDEDEDGSKLKAILGMVIDFTLPASAYATIALRELMKRPTSRDYQTELKLEGDCEANVGKANEKAKEENSAGKVCAGRFHSTVAGGDKAPSPRTRSRGRRLVRGHLRSPQPHASCPAALREL